MAASYSYGSTKQRSESECVDYDREDAESVLDCTICLWTFGDSGDTTLSYAILILHKLKQERKARLPVPVPLALGSVLILGQLYIASNSNLNGRKTFLR